MVKYATALLLSALCCSPALHAQNGMSATPPEKAMDIAQPAAPETSTTQTQPTAANSGSQSMLPAGSVVYLTVNDEISSLDRRLGDRFGITVMEDVLLDNVIAIPKGTIGQGEVTFVTKNGAFGKPGILGIAVRQLDLNGKQIPLDGRYREEAGNNNNAAVATMFAVGIAAILVKGKTSVIPKGRQLKARTAEDFFILPATANTISSAEVAQKVQ